MALNGYEKPLAEYSKADLITIARKYTVYYTSETGGGRISGYEKLSKNELIDIISNDRDYVFAGRKISAEKEKEKLINEKLGRKKPNITSPKPKKKTPEPQKVVSIPGLDEEEEKEEEKPKTRLQVLKEKTQGLDDPEDIMIAIIEVLSETEMVPDQSGFYTFIYNAKTPNITYDQHPLIEIISINKWGFIGFNYHWPEPRQYTWMEIAGGLHVVKPDEMEYLKSLKYAKFISK